MLEGSIADHCQLTGPVTSHFTSHTSDCKASQDPRVASGGTDLRNKDSLPFETGICGLASFTGFGGSHAI